MCLFDSLCWVNLDHPWDGSKGREGGVPSPPPPFLWKKFLFRSLSADLEQRFIFCKLNRAVLLHRAGNDVNQCWVSLTIFLHECWLSSSSAVPCGHIPGSAADFEETLWVHPLKRKLEYIQISRKGLNISYILAKALEKHASLSEEINFI